MPLKIFNTLTGKKELFEPIKNGKINLFVCGPTVYDFSHLGHGKTYTQFDVLVKFLRYVGYEVFYLQNLTDIDDKIINRAREQDIPWNNLTEKYTKIYFEDMQALGNNSVSEYAKATDFIPEIIKQIETLLERGYAYKISDGIYFETAKFKEYGKLSGRRDLKEDDSVSRIDEARDKKGWNDFCLWKNEKPGEPSWTSPFGKGRPGWHIEDTAITETRFGPQYDIHGGGRDLIFPHHECEIAQMEATSGLEPLVRYWMHTGFFNVDSKKMSKSVGNFKTIREMIKTGVSPMAFRLLVLGSHYRSPMNLNVEALEGADTTLKRLYRQYLDMGEQIGRINEKYQSRFKEYLEDDLDTSRAITVLWDVLKDENLSFSDKKATLLDFDKVFGLGLSLIKEDIIPEKVTKLAKEREEARKNKDFKKSDELRKEINELGYEIKDMEKSYKISKI